MSNSTIVTHDAAELPWRIHSTTIRSLDLDPYAYGGGRTVWVWKFDRYTKVVLDRDRLVDIANKNGATYKIPAHLVTAVTRCAEAGAALARQYGCTGEIYFGSTHRHLELIVRHADADSAARALITLDLHGAIEPIHQLTLTLTHATAATLARL